MVNQKIKRLKYILNKNHPMKLWNATVLSSGKYYSLIRLPGKTVELLIHREYNTCEVLLKEYTRTVGNYIWACDFGRKPLFQGVSVLKPKV